MTELKFLGQLSLLRSFNWCFCGCFPISEIIATWTFKQRWKVFFFFFWGWDKASEQPWLAGMLCSLGNLIFCASAGIGGQQTQINGVEHGRSFHLHPSMPVILSKTYKCLDFGLWQVAVFYFAVENVGVSSLLARDTNICLTILRQLGIPFRYWGKQLPTLGDEGVQNVCDVFLYLLNLSSLFIGEGIKRKW